MIHAVEVSALRASQLNVSYGTSVELVDQHGRRVPRAWNSF